MIKIGFLGPKGTFSQEALRKYTMGIKDWDEVEFANINELFEGVAKGKIDEAVVPIENSLEGAIGASMDMLACDMNLFIKEEVIIRVNQNLLVKSGAGFEDIKVVASHPQPIGQCRKYLADRFPNAIVKYTYSTAEAAMDAAKSNGEIAAIGSETAAHEYGLDILAQKIQDGDNNVTRFFVIAAEDGKPTGKDKTSIVFSSEDKPGSLYRILDIFNLWDINMTRIESRPSKNKLGEYVFFVDILGHRSEEDINSAITMIKRKTSFLKILGSYPACEKY